MEQTKLLPECGQEGVSINNHESMRFFPLGLPLQKVDGNWWGYKDMPVLPLLEPGVVIYRNVISPHLPPHFCQRPRDQQISIYCCPGAHSNEPPVCTTTYKPCSGLWSGWELLPLWKLGEKERERSQIFSFPGRRRSGNLTWTHIKATKSIKSGVPTLPSS